MAAGAGGGYGNAPKKKKTTFKPPKIDFSGGIVSTGGTPPPWQQANPIPDNFSATGGVQAPISMEDILKNDPYYQAALANLNAQGIYDKTSRDQAIKQAMIRFGFAPEAVAGMTFPEPVLGQPGHVAPRSLADILDPATRELAKQNTSAGLSIWARLADAASQAQKRTVDVLGSRGLFRSGETGYQLKRGTLASDQAKYDATNKLMDFLTGAQAAYVQAEMQRQALLLAAQKEAAENAANNPPVTPPPTTPPTTNPNHKSPPPEPHYPLGPGLDPSGSSFPDPPQPTGGPWNPPVGPILDTIFPKKKPVGGKGIYAQ